MGNENNPHDTMPKNLGDGIDLMMGDTLPKQFVEMMLKTNERLAKESGQNNEREENVCRLLASGMSIDEISLILKIRADEIRIIESNNAKNKIPEYTRTYKARQKTKKNLRKGSLSL